MINRKLIRPTMADMSGTASKFSTPGRKRVPPEQTHAENFYYVKQMNNRTPMILRLTNGEEIQGYIEWYDRDCIKVNREGAPNLLVYKTSILYMFKKEDLLNPGGDDSSEGRKAPRHKNYGERAGGEDTDF